MHHGMGYGCMGYLSPVNDVIWSDCMIVLHSVDVSTVTKYFDLFEWESY